MRWQQKVDQLHSTITALEAEKADMIEKLSHAKQEGVKVLTSIRFNALHAVFS